MYHRVNFHQSFEKISHGVIVQLHLCPQSKWYVQYKLACFSYLGKYLDLDLELEQFVIDVSKMPWIQGPFLRLFHLCGHHKGRGRDSHLWKDSPNFLGLDQLDKLRWHPGNAQPYLHFEITWRDVSASACMTVRLIQAVLAGSTLGKGRFQE